MDPANGHVARSTAVGQLVISLGEHRAHDADVLGPEDLAVGCDGRRMYLAVPERGVRIEAAALHALNLRTAPHTVLVEAPEPTNLGWTGGRAHEVVFPVTATRPPALWPALPRPASAHRLRHGSGSRNGGSSASATRANSCDCASRAFGPATAAVSAWAGELHVAGLLSEVTYPISYREKVRWDAAEEVFRADSAAALARPARDGDR
ncbi:lantibiotic dehydratase [Kitasatospora cineracea]|uniref:lantibiotic dehydratase n=1 Tax=Kitasatospora cineracea TaxID=88074 RepID=UPI0037F339ED